jgi:hypothetical protein
MGRPLRVQYPGAIYHIMCVLESGSKEEASTLLVDLPANCRALLELAHEDDFRPVLRHLAAAVGESTILSKQSKTALLRSLTEALAVSQGER